MAILLYDLVGKDDSRPFSPHCWKVAMALAHKGLAFETVPTRFLEVPEIENGFTKTVPLIRDGDTLVTDSFAIAQYLEATYPDRPSLFGGAGGEALSRFVERWSQLTIHPYIAVVAVTDINAMQDDDNTRYFRASRESLFNKTLEDVTAGRDEGLAAFRASLKPLRSMLEYQPFIGGASPLFADYIVFGAFQWARVVSDYPLLETDDPVRAWFERCLDLHGGLGRTVAAA